MNNSDLIIYQTEDGLTKIQARLENETVWLSQQELTQLFAVTKPTISEHFRNIFESNELDKDTTVRKFRTVQKEGSRDVSRDIEYYNLDAIISLGYRLNSTKATQFRQWATRTLKDYLVKGYAINHRRLQESEQQLAEFKKLVILQNDLVTKNELENNETKGLIQVIANYAKALNLLDDYDHQRMELPVNGTKVAVKITYREAKKAIEQLGKQTKFEGLFGNEKDDSFRGSLDNIYLTFDGNDLYNTTQEKAANLLYFVVKNHSFTDGNKRIAAFIFVWFLEINNLLYSKLGTKIVSDSTLVALTLMIAQSNPKDKDMMIKVVVNLLLSN